MEAGTASPPAPARPRLLCVDDEPYVLEAIRDRLRRSFDVKLAEGGIEGLKLLQAEPDGYAIVLSDMRMPGMAGDAFLREARTVAPNTVRMLLTGHADVDAAIRAVNHSQLFRFLTKPCDGEELMRACAAALGHHRLLTAERVLVEQTLRGAVEALAVTLALANPAAFGRGARVKEIASRLADAVNLKNRWEVEVAAALAHIGAITLPAATAEKWYSGEELTAEENAMVSRIPRMTRQLLAHIPRLEGVLDVLEAYQTTPEPDNPVSMADVPEGARILRIAVDLDTLESAGRDAADAISLMREKRIYDPYLLGAIADSLAAGKAATGELREIQISQLAIGMTLADDVRSDNGGLLVARGQPVTEQLIELLLNMRSDAIRQPIAVYDGQSDA